MIQFASYVSRGLFFSYSWPYRFSGSAMIWLKPLFPPIMYFPVLYLANEAE